ncbi:unnamed protein product [Heterobilharzia americana]|nr:unnamed protein product [Heterobilharzia americana]CAH8573349.1 unnamed protein product [Heterobilharzia americana]
MGDSSVIEEPDKYEHYNYDEDKIAGSKGGKNRTKKDADEHHKKSENRANRVHIDHQVNNEEKQREQNLKHSSDAST